MIGRVCLGLGIVLAWGSLARVLHVDGLPHAPWGLHMLPMNPAVAMVATGLFLVTLGFFLAERRPALARDAPPAAGGGTPADFGAIGLVALLAAGTKALEWQWAPGMGVNGATSLPGATVLAWWVARRLGRDGVEAACGVVGASYALAALSKVYMSGLAWASGGNIALQIATQAWLAPPPVRDLRLAAASSPLLCGALGVGTLIIESGALLYVFPRARLAAAAAIVAMHIGISALMGLHHYDWMFTALGWALVGRWRAPRPG